MITCQSFHQVLYNTEIWPPPTCLCFSWQSAKIKKGSKGDATVLRPTLMTAVPVIMDRLYKAVWEKVNEGGKLSRALFIFAYDYKTRKLARGYDTPLFNR